jgi:predicted dienelactone hydrolase
VTRFWQRTEDVSFVIDSLDTVLPKHLTMANANIVVMGHSSGGHTAAALAGVTMNIKKCMIIVHPIMPRRI